jgi:integrase
MTAEVQAALLVLAKLGITPADLLQDPAPARVVPTFAEYIPVVSAAVSASSRRACGSSWKKVAQQWGSRRLDEPTPTEVKQLAELVRAGALVRRNARGGRGAVENLLTALRCLYRHAVADGLVADNVAVKVDKPRRQASTRRALPEDRLTQINQVAATTGNDPALDTLLLRIHIETACRRGGALALRPMDLDREQCLILLREKRDTTRWQPVSPSLMANLHDHAQTRGALRAGRLLRYRNGQPVTRRRYDHLWRRVGEHLPWVATQQISTHWLRHTTLTWVERNFGFAVARAYAGHSESDHDVATTTYIRASVHEVAAALAALTGEPHPLAT